MIVDLHGKAGHIRTVPIPLWVKEALDRWTEASGINDGCLFRAINKSGKIWGQGRTPKVLWEIVKKAAEAAGVEKLASHGLRRYAEYETMPNAFASGSPGGLFGAQWIGIVRTVNMRRPQSASRSSGSL